MAHPSGETSIAANSRTVEWRNKTDIQIPDFQFMLYLIRFQNMKAYRGETDKTNMKENGKTDKLIQEGKHKSGPKEVQKRQKTKTLR